MNHKSKKNTITEIKKKNYFYTMIEGSLYVSSFTLMDVSTFLSMFLFAYSGDYKLVGLIAAIRLLSMNLPQIFVGYYMGFIKNIGRATKIIILLSRPLPLIIPLILISDISNGSKIAGFFVVFVIMELCEGLKSVPWLDLVSRSIEQNVRGKLHGKHMLYGGIGSILVSALVKKIIQMDKISMDQRYSLFFMVVGLIGLLSALSMVFVKDLQSEPLKRHTSLWAYFKALPQYVRNNKLFRKVIAIQCNTTLACLMTPFIIVFCKSKFSLADAQVANLVLIQVVGSFIGGIVWGNISFHFGNKKVIQSAQALVVCMNLLLVSCFYIQSEVWILVISIIINAFAGINMGAWLGTTNFLIDVVEESSRPTYLVIGSVFMLPFTSISYIAGNVADRFGFFSLIMVGLFFSLVGLYHAMKLEK